MSPKMRWLWLVIEEPYLMATVDLDDTDRIRNVPPQFNQFEGIKKNDFIQLLNVRFPGIHVEEKYFNDNPKNRINELQEL